ncbi:hypothetical protein BST95_18350 [Halioglobus japonicus]|uniref:type IV pilin protein n=1 Tax=Halioglobus japonicus TaxID=930805 RepID=UPI00097931F3|nr:prepilin-type N-terminal cleavage/methylation domain-containing protein [Halioglobus japonicus]AQA19914.1 hypothetical protein BST95_18350 [Halioglobus japonicus]GHD23207.1 type 4 fimbrial biogenesis protein PilE [Halioglobus japonicus]
MRLQLGFSLLELLIALVITAILMTIALPAYRHIQIRSHRVIGIAVLQDLAARQERFWLEHRRYALSLVELGLVEDYFIDGGANLVRPSQAVYRVELKISEGDFLAVAAWPQNDQRLDRQCGILTLGRDGQRSVSGELAAHPQQCW